MEDGIPGRGGVCADAWPAEHACWRPWGSWAGLEPKGQRETRLEKGRRLVMKGFVHGGMGESRRRTGSGERSSGCGNVEMPVGDR